MIKLKRTRQEWIELIIGLILTAIVVISSVTFMLNYKEDQNDVSAPSTKIEAAAPKPLLGCENEAIGQSSNCNMPNQKP